MWTSCLPSKHPPLMSIRKMFHYLTSLYQSVTAMGRRTGVTLMRRCSVRQAGEVTASTAGITRTGRTANGARTTTTRGPGIDSVPPVTVTPLVRCISVCINWIVRKQSPEIGWVILQIIELQNDARTRLLGPHWYHMPIGVKCRRTSRFLLLIWTLKQQWEFVSTSDELTKFFWVMIFCWK